MDRLGFVPKAVLRSSQARVQELEYRMDEAGRHIDALHDELSEFFRLPSGLSRMFSVDPARPVSLDHYVIEIRPKMHVIRVYASDIERYRLRLHKYAAEWTEQIAHSLRPDIERALRDLSRNP